MKLNKLTAACALALAAVSGQALALTAFEAPDLGGPILLSGASAPQNTLGSLAGLLFEPGFFTYHDDNGTTANTGDDGKLFRAYFGVVKTGAGFASNLEGKKVLLIDRAKGGSVWGVNPVARAEAIQTLNVSSGACTLVSGIYRCAMKGTDPNLPGYPVGGEQVPDFGVSDVAPNMFKNSYNVEFGASQLTESEGAVFGGTVFPAFSIMMGFAANSNVPAAATLSRADYGAMLTGNIANWKNVDNPTNLVAGGSAGSGPVIVCRRVPGSGTQASYNWYFNGFPCVDQSLGLGSSSVPARMPNCNGTFDVDNPAPAACLSGTGTPADPYILSTSSAVVIENSASGDVRNCLIASAGGTIGSNPAGQHNWVAEDGKSYRTNFPAGSKAIGVLSLDSIGGAGEGSNWFFRNMEGSGTFNGTTQTASAGSTGISPSETNHIEGRYDFAVETTFQYRNDYAAGDRKDFIDLFIARAGDPVVLDNVGTGLKKATLAVPPAFDPTTTANVAKVTHFGNMCTPLQKLY
jgi:hypothetical protein